MTSEREQVLVESQYGPLFAFKDDLITRQIEQFGNHTRPEFAFALSVLDFEFGVFDIGAHIGTFSVAALAKMGSRGSLVSLEGNSTTFKLLQSNCHKRGYAKSVQVNSFCGEGEGYVYQENDSNTGGSRLVRAVGDQKGVDWVTLDGLANTYFIPDYIKMDIEGAEFAALHNSNIVNQRRPILYLEVSQQLRTFGHSSEALNTLLTSLGYVFFVNTGERNARHDMYQVEQVAALHKYKGFFDVLCVIRGSEAHRAIQKISRRGMRSRLVSALKMGKQ